MLKRGICILGLLTLFTHFSAAYAQEKQTLPDERRYQADTGRGFYLNPIMCGNYADPSVMRDGDDYYMTHSTFTDMPGLTVWHSRDLVNWEPISHALHKYVGSVWAPDMVKHKDTYYIYFPASGVNYVVTAKNPRGPWSDPVNLKIGEIDPGHVVAPDGKRYLHMSGGNIVPLSEDGLSVTGEMTHVYDGWRFPAEWIVECFCLESPKLTFKNGWYYLTSAQGGTAGPPTSHMTISARSRTPFGPWENSPYNPIIRNTRRDSKWVSTGHGTLVDSPDGKWWIVFHGYERENRTIGRQTLLLPIEWTEDGWFRVPNGADIDRPLPKPKGERIQEHGMQLSDDFSGETLGRQWSAIENDDKTKFTVAGNALRIKCNGQFPSKAYPLVLMPQNNYYEIEAEITAPKGTEGGLLFYFNPRYYAGMSLEDGNVYLLSSHGGKSKFAEGFGERVWFRIVNDHHDLLCYWSKDGKEWTRADFVRDLSGFHHNALSDWGVLRPGVFGSGTGTVEVKRFRYAGLD